MNYIDYIIIALALLGFILGFKDGLIRKLIGITGFILAVFLAYRFSSDGGEFISSLFNYDPILSEIVAGIIIFFLIIIATSVIKRIVHPGDKVTMLTNQILGGIVGILQIAVFLSAAFLLLNIFNFPGKEESKSSVLYKGVYNIIPYSIDFIVGSRPTAKNFFQEYIESKDSI